MHPSIWTPPVALSALEEKLSVRGFFHPFVLLRLVS